jgi:hypothetical protein
MRLLSIYLLSVDRYFILNDYLNTEYEEAIAAASIELAGARWSTKTIIPGPSEYILLYSVVYPDDRHYTNKQMVK